MRFAFEVSAEDRQPDDVRSNAIIGDALESFYDVGEPPTAHRSGGRHQDDEAHFSEVALEDFFQLINVAKLGNPNSTV
jgi:hypothetical protein